MNMLCPAAPCKDSLDFRHRQLSSLRHCIEIVPYICRKLFTARLTLATVVPQAAVDMGKGGGASGRTRAAGGKKGVQKDDDLKDTMHKLAVEATSKLDGGAEERLMDWVKTHPKGANYLWQQVSLGAFNYLDDPSSGSGQAKDDARLPSWLNKFNLLDVPRVIPILQSLMPKAAEWLGKVKKGKKSKWAQVLGFILHTDPTSALPTKRVDGLNEWLRKRHESFGRRLKDWEPPRPNYSLDVPCLDMSKF